METRKKRTTVGSQPSNCKTVACAGGAGTRQTSQFGSLFILSFVCFCVQPLSFECCPLSRTQQIDEVRASAPYLLRDADFSENDSSLAPPSSHSPHPPGPPASASRFHASISL